MHYGIKKKTYKAIPISKEEYEDSEGYILNGNPHLCDYALLFKTKQLLKDIPNKKNEEGIICIICIDTDTQEPAFFNYELFEMFKFAFKDKMPKKLKEEFEKWEMANNI